MPSVHFIYGTTGGNTELVVDQVQALLKEAGIACSAARAEESAPADMRRADVTVLAAPTYGQGILQEDMGVFHAALQTFPLSGQKCAVIGLGDPPYELQYHIESAAILESAILEAKGQIVLPALKISGSPVRFLDTLIPAWTKKLIDLLTT